MRRHRKIRIILNIIFHRTNRICQLLFYIVAVISGCRKHICSCKQEDCRQTKQQEIHTESRMRQQRPDTIYECTGTHNNNGKCHPFICRITSVIDSLLLSRLAEIHINIRLIFQKLFCLFQSVKTLSCLCSYIDLPLSFRKPSFFLCQLTLCLHTMYRNVRIRFLYISKEPVHIFFVFEIALLFLTIAICNHKIG